MPDRIEYDSIGPLPIPEHAYYGVQSLRAKYHFSLSQEKLHPLFVKNLAVIKKVAAETNCKANVLTEKTAEAIVRASEEIVDGHFREEFIVDAVQGGAGTSANMNIKEVIAHRASELMGGTKDTYALVHPNDHVNCSQSTNDVFPTAGKLTVIDLMHPLILTLSHLDKVLGEKSEEFTGVLKMARKPLQDAVPTTLGHSFRAYQSAVSRDIHHLNSAMETMYTVNIGGTAIGSSINAPEGYVSRIATNLAEETGLPLKQAEDLFDATQSVDSFVRVSGAVKTAALTLSKMSNDLRLLSSGPTAGFGEINLPAKQNGSSIMPGKINPVILEVVSQVAFEIIGNDVTITMAAESGQLELNPFEPIIFKNLFSSIELLTNAARTLTANCIEGITANKTHCQDQVERSVGIATCFCPYIGYEKAAHIAKESLRTGVSVRQLLLDSKWMSREQINHILDIGQLARGISNSEDNVTPLFV